MSDSPSSPIKRHKDDRLGTEVRLFNRSHPASAPAMPQLGMTVQGPTRSASLDLGILQKPQLFPNRSERKSANLILFPTVFVKQNKRRVPF